MTAEDVFRAADDRVHAAELSGDTEVLAAALRVRALAWRAWAATFPPDARERTGATLAALRDDVDADRLSGGEHRSGR